MKKKSALTIHVEYIAFRMLCAFVNIIPYRVAMVLAQGIALFLFDVVRVKRRRTLSRLREVFPNKSRREHLFIARSSLSNILQIAVEMTRAPHLNRKWMDRYVVDGLYYKNKLQSYLDEGRGAVIMVPHSGNWYMAAWSMAKYGLPLCAIAAKQRNPLIYAWMKRQYGDAITALDRGTTRTLVDIKNLILTGHAFAILPDLRVPQKDVTVPFLNGTANVSHAGAMFAVATGAPIIVASMRREKGRHVLTHLATLRPNPQAESRAEAEHLTREVMKILDQEIQAHPEQWFWFNSRWILQPVNG